MGRTVICRGFIKLASEFLIGDRVRHKEYGIGKVTCIEFFAKTYSK